jgi:hypothetical protein
MHRLIDRKQQFCLYEVADPNQELLNSYYAKVQAAKRAHALDPNEPDPDKIITAPSRSGW